MLFGGNSIVRSARRETEFVRVAGLWRTAVERLPMAIDGGGCPMVYLWMKLHGVDAGQLVSF